MKQAKIQISADVSQLRRSVEESKKALGSLNQIKLSKENTAALKENLNMGLVQTIAQIKGKISESETELQKLARVSGKAFDKSKVAAYSEALGRLKTQLKEAQELQGQGAGGGIGGKISGMFKGGMSGGMRAAGALGIGVGVASLYNRGVDIAQSRTKLRAMTGGDDINERSRLGYTAEERRDRATGLAGAVGANMNGGELSKLTDLSEKIERGYGISGDDTAGAVKQSRMAGNTDQYKFLAQTVGTAVAMGLEGSRVGDYLQSMTGYMEELSSGITVHSDSINGVAAAIGDIPFFKNDPNRMFAQMRGMDGAFRGGDRFQQAQAARAIQAGTPNAGASAIELRRSLGLFANTKGLAKEFKGTNLEGVMSQGPNQLINNLVGDVQKNTAGMGTDDRVMEIMSRLGLQGEGGMMMASKIMKGESVTGEEMQRASMSPEKQFEAKLQDRVNETYKSTERSILNLRNSIDALNNTLATQIAGSLAKLAEGITGITDMLGLTAEGNGEMLGAAGVGGAGIYAASKIGGSAIGKGATNLANKGLAKGVGKAFGKGAARALPGVGNVINAGFAAKDWYDVYQKGGDAGWQDYTKAGLSTAGMFFPPAGAASAAMELLPESTGSQTSPITTPMETGAMTAPATPASTGTSPGTSGAFPAQMMTNDPEANAHLRQMVQLLQNRGVGASRMPTGATVFQGKVGK